MESDEKSCECEPERPGIEAQDDVEEAIRHAEDHGWRIEVGGSHAWGRMYCPYNDQECRCGEFCITSIWSTPRNVWIDLHLEFNRAFEANQ